MMGPGAFLAVALAASIGTPAVPSAVSVTRLDCGKFVVNNLGGNGPRTLNNGCYLIRHGETLMIWDAGLPKSLIGKPDVSAEQTISLDEALVPQLGRLDVKPADIKLIGISHYHGDHLGQASEFPNAKLLIGTADLDVIKSSPDRDEGIEPWLTGGAALQTVDGDVDVFGDGSVTMLSTPGHTPGHHSLLVRLPDQIIILTGDAAHFRDQLVSLKASGNATDKAAGAESLKRLVALASAEKARIVVQHDPVDDDALPAVPLAKP